MAGAVNDMNDLFMYKDFSLKHACFIPHDFTIVFESDKGSSRYFFFNIIFIGSNPNFSYSSKNTAKHTAFPQHPGSLVQFNHQAALARLDQLHFS